MDWMGTVSTAVVGLAGIAATVWGGVSVQRHQSRRADIEAKRRVYAHVFACVDQVVNAIRRVRNLREAGGELRQAIERMEELRQDFNSAMYELHLICPPAVRDVSEELRAALKDRANRAETGVGIDFSVRDYRARLLEVMRADLG